MIFTFENAVAAARLGESPERLAQKLLEQLSLHERLSLLDGDLPFWEGLRGILCDRYNRRPFVMGQNRRVGIPGIRFTDGPRGVVMGASTAFPVPMARGATWDCQLEERVGEAIALEGRAQGANLFAGVCVNLPRHPAWGRVQETYGEDPILLGEFGAALTRGVRQNLMACVKHFALNSMENARFGVDVIADERALHEVYLPHFKRVLEEGAEGVMSAYNSVNGEWAGQSKLLLGDILRDQWGFDGFTMSDFIFGLRNAVTSVQNGLDLEAPFAQQRAEHLPQAVRSGELGVPTIDKACLRLLSKQIAYEAFVSPRVPDESVIFCDAHRKLAREVAARSMVLLENRNTNGRPMLPLDSTSIGPVVAVIGRLANAANTGDRGSSAVFPPSEIPLYQGIKSAIPTAMVNLDDSDDAVSASDSARRADVAIVVVGYDASDEGEYVVPSFQTAPLLESLLPAATSNQDEQLRKTLMAGDSTGYGSGEGGTGDAAQALRAGDGGDRHSLRLRDRDVQIIKAACKANQRTIVCLVTAGAVIMEDWKSLPAAVVVSWYSGSEGGHALADVLLGKIDASGRLPFSIPRTENDLPFFCRDAKQITYDIWFGQRLLDRNGATAAYPLGYGLSYADVSLLSSSFTDSESIDILSVNVTVCNRSYRPARYIAQVYGRTEVAHFPTRVLLGFRPVDLSGGETKQACFHASLRPLMLWCRGEFRLVSNSFEIEIGAFAGDKASTRERYTVGSGQTSSQIKESIAML